VDVRLLRIRGCVNAEVTTRSIIITSATFNSSAQWGKTWPDVETADYQNGERGIKVEAKMRRRLLMVRDGRGRKAAML
jgi:hypothetical protein